MRTVGPGSLLPPTTEGTPTQLVLAFDDNRLASVLFGQYAQNLALIERRLNVVAEQRGNHVTISGSRVMSSSSLWLTSRRRTNGWKFEPKRTPYGGSM